MALQGESKNYASWMIYPSWEEWKVTETCGQKNKFHC